MTDRGNNNHCSNFVMVIDICYNIAEIAILLLSNLKLDEKNQNRTDY
jgi:hypothetical protein